MDYGVLTLLPALAVVIFAIITKLCLESLIVGVISCFVVAYGTGFYGPLMDMVYGTFGHSDTVWIVVLMLMLGVLIKLTERTKGVEGFANFILKFCTTPKKTGIAAWLMGIVIFIDDYLNVISVGASMKPLYDRHKIPREMLAYNMNSTAAPVCLVVPITSFVVFFGAIFADQPELSYLGSGVQIYYKAIPYIFYAWVAVIIVPLVTLGIIPKIGPMKKALERAEKTGKTFSDDAASFYAVSNENNFSDDIKPDGKAIDFIIPMGIFIIISLATLDILMGIFVSTAIASIWYLATRKLSIKEWSSAIYEGLGSMVGMAAICATAYLLKDSMAMINLPQYIIDHTAAYFNAALFPAATFIIVSLLVFITGSSWGVPAVTVPIIVPLCFAIGANPVLTVAAILSASGFGCQGCLYSSDLVLAASTAGITPVEHFKTQIPYAGGAALLSLILYVVCGMILI